MDCMSFSLPCLTLISLQRPQFCGVLLRTPGREGSLGGLCGISSAQGHCFWSVSCQYSGSWKLSRYSQTRNKMVVKQKNWLWLVMEGYVTRMDHWRGTSVLVSWSWICWASLLQSWKVSWIVWCAFPSGKNELWPANLHSVFFLNRFFSLMNTHLFAASTWTLCPNQCMLAHYFIDMLLLFFFFKKNVLTDVFIYWCWFSQVTCSLSEEIQGFSYQVFGL